MSKLKVLILNWIMFLVGCTFGWLIIAFAADLFTTYVIRENTRFYTTGSYTDFLGGYVFSSVVFILLLKAIGLSKFFPRILLNTLFVLTFLFLLFMFIEDDVKTGRPIIPEIVFLLVIAVFHIFLLKYLKLTNHSPKT